MTVTELRNARNTEVVMLNRLASTLKEDFNAHFGEDAVNKYYHGKEKIQKLNNDGSLKFFPSGTPCMGKKPYNPHFPHERLSDELFLDAMYLHPKLVEAFKAEAMYQCTKDAGYAMLRDDLFDDFKTKAQQHQLEAYQGVTEEQLDEFKSELEKSAAHMIQDLHAHCSAA